MPYNLTTRKKEKQNPNSNIHLFYLIAMSERFFKKKKMEKGREKHILNIYHVKICYRHFTNVEYLNLAMSLWLCI